MMLQIQFWVKMGQYKNVYSPQKGAKEEDIITLNEGLTNFVKVIEKKFKRNISKLVGGGSAGGTAAGLHGFFGTLKSLVVVEFRLGVLYIKRFNQFRK